MNEPLGERLRLTVLGCSTAAPHPDTPTAGYLVEWGSTAILLDVGQGVIRNLQNVLDPHDLSGIVIGHMHADHYLDIVGLRYLYPWGQPSPTPLPVHLPPGGRARLDALARAISERDGFFDAAFTAVEYDPDQVLAIGDLRLRFVRGRHYVPAWGVIVEAPDGTRLAYTGDTGPSTAVEDAVRGADLLLVESALGLAAHDDLERAGACRDRRRRRRAPGRGRTSIDEIRSDLAEVLDRHAIASTTPARGRRKRRRTGQRTARENVDDLCDPGTLRRVRRRWSSPRNAGAARSTT